MTKFLLFISLLGLVACTTSEKVTPRAPSNANDYTYVDNCDYPYRTNLKGLLIPAKTDRDYNFSVVDAINANPKKWQKIDFKEVAPLMNAIMNKVSGSRAVCIPEDRAELGAQLEHRRDFFNELSGFLYRTKGKVKSGEERTFEETISPSYEERSLMSSASSLHNYARSALKEVDKLLTGDLAKIRDYANADKLACYRSTEKYNLHPQYANYGYDKNPSGSVVYCFGSTVYSKDFGVEGMGSDKQTRNQTLGLLFWDLGDKNQETLDSKYFYHHMLMGIFADDKRVE